MKTKKIYTERTSQVECYFTELNKLAKELNKKFNHERKSNYTSFRGYVARNVEEGTIKLPEWCDEFDLYEACDEIEY